MRSTAKRTSLQAAADEASRELAKKVGSMLKDARRQRAMTQAQAAVRAGISASEWSVLELGRRPATVPTINRAAFAVGGRLDAFIRQASRADLPRDAVHLRHQELIIRTAVKGAWTALPEEMIDRNARTSRAADVLLHRRRTGTPHEYALIEVIDWFDDVGAPTREWVRRVEAAERYAIARMAPSDETLPLTSGCWVVRATVRNRRLIGAHRHFFRARFPGSGGAWPAALSEPDSPMPTRPAVLWVSVDGKRLYPVRWPASPG